MKIFVLFVLLRVSQHASADLEVNEGQESVVLPCQVTAPVNNISLVEWRRSEPVMTVHVRRNNRDQPNDQNEAYQGRTSLRQDALKTGDLSLTLKSVSVSDKGKYTCTASQAGTSLGQAEVQLQVQSKVEEELRTQRNVFIVLTSLLLPVCGASLTWIFITLKNRKDTSAPNL